jgi:hypothetical protein
MQSESFVLGIGAGVVLLVAVAVVGPRLYADALAEGRDREAGLWALLCFGGN